MEKRPGHLGSKCTICGGKPDFIEPPRSSLQNPQNVPIERHKSPDLSPALRLAQYLKSVANTFERDFRARDATKHPYALSEGTLRKTAGPVLCRFRRMGAGASDEPSLISGRHFSEVSSLVIGARVCFKNPVIGVGKST